MNSVPDLNMGMLVSLIKPIRTTVAVLPILWMGMATDILAQDVAVGAAQANVQAVVSVTSSNDLGFGDVLQGVPNSVANNSSSAAVFEISGQADAGIDLYLQLPEYLWLSGSGDRLSIVFSTTDASVDTTGAGDPTSMNGTKGWQNTNPHSLPTGSIVGSSGTDIYLGGTVVPSINQKAGSYSGEIILTVAYNGS